VHLGGSMIKERHIEAFDSAEFELCEFQIVEEIRKSVNKDSVIFSDFDGTITVDDVVDKFLSIYAGESWMEIEELWEAGEIGSEMCLMLQLACIKLITVDELIGFTSDIAIDPYLSKFVRFVKRNGIDLYVLSDGFDCLIELILGNHGIAGIPTFANSLRIEDNKPIPSFPFKVGQCLSGSGMCKCAIIEKYRQDRLVIYIGDGRSDKCAVGRADIVFAKGKLSNYCSDKSIEFFEFSNFGDVLECLVKKETIDVIR
jgi:2-hydroxy-3-keto-5-methylthiopentenyl-1-phosphate phosphatase